MITEKQQEIASEAVAKVVMAAFENGFRGGDLGKVAKATAQALVTGFDEINRAYDKSR